MKQEILRLRMFAGPNGSGKSTFKSIIRPELLGVFVNPDEIEQQIRKYDFLNLNGYGVTSTKREILDFFTNSSLLKTAKLLDETHNLNFDDDKLSFLDVTVNSYFASVAADFIRHKLMDHAKSFTFETVMSFTNKIELLQKAQLKGYRRPLYQYFTCSI